ncbi:SDR family NAD(P)-dependent oxidoreductase [Myxococcota bacterium]|nr:SDR family NAD(P)-dependent oxidoreductase [Myxococcota bacterium]
MPSPTPWAVLTGASSGIGRALAPKLAARGYGLVLVARDAEALGSLAATLAVPTRILSLDLSAPDASARLGAETAELDVGLVVLNAGFGSAGPFLQADAAADQAQLAVNCASVLGACHVFAPRLVARRSGALVLVGSVLGFQGVPGQATYAATKAFVQALAEGLAPELGAKGVSVLCVAPGPTHTGFAARAGMRMGRADAAEDVAAEISTAIGRKGTQFPGLMAKLLRWGVLTLPRRLRTFIFGRAVAGMIGG